MPSSAPVSRADNPIIGIRAEAGGLEFEHREQRAPTEVAINHTDRKPGGVQPFLNESDVIALRPKA